MSVRSSLLLPVFATLSFGLVVVPAGVLLWRHAFEPLPQDALQVLRLVHHEVLDNYVTEKNADDLVLKAVAGMVSSLDDYSQFVAPEAVEAFEGSQLEGTYVGIGVLLFGDCVPITVQSPLLGSPAEVAGLLPGDRILAVDGEAIDGDDPRAAIDLAIGKLRGQPGTSSLLQIGRGDGEPFTVPVGHAHVVQPRVKWAHLADPDARLGYVYVSGFQRDVTAAFDAAVRQLQSQAGGPLRGLVLDLRHNPGGLLDEAIALVNRFVADGEIVSLRRRNEVLVERHVADPQKCTLPELPLVVLIDGVSASASEVVTGALQDHGRARVVGVRSFGKGVVQSILSWQGQEFRLKLTTSHYYTPNGRNIERTLRRAGDGEAEGGIAPDVEIQVDRDRQRLIASRLGANEVPAIHLEAARAAAAAIGQTVREPLLPDEDPQLAAAIDELRKSADAANEGR